MELYFAPLACSLATRISLYEVGAPAAATRYVQVDTRSFPVFEGDRFLLCSDGLHGYLEPFEIGSLMDGSIDVVVERAIGLANQRGGRDNITAIAVELRA